MSISMLQGKMLQKVDTLYSFVLFFTRCCILISMFFPVSIMFHAKYVKCFTFLPTISWVVMFHVNIILYNFLVHG